MHRQWIGAALLVGLAMTTAGTLLAQQRQSLPAGQPSIMNDEADTAPAPPPKPPRLRGQKPPAAFEHDPDLDAADQLAPSQVDQPIARRCVDAERRLACPCSGGCAGKRCGA